MSNLEKVCAVLKFADEKYANGRFSEIEDWSDGVDTLLDEGDGNADRLAFAVFAAFYADHVTKSLQERIAELDLLLSRPHPRGTNPECVYLDELS